MDPLRSARPPTITVMPESAYTFTYASHLICVVCIAFAINKWIRQGDSIFLLFILGGTLCVAWEPIIDMLGCDYFAPENEMVIFTYLGRRVPWFMASCYGWYNGGLGYIWLRQFQDKTNPMTRGGLWKMWSLAFAINLPLEAPPNLLKYQEYYGFQPFMVLGMPLWFPAVNATMPLVAASLVNVLGKELRGWKQLAIILIMPSASGLANAAMAWPVWIALQLDLGYHVTYPAALLTLTLVVIGIWIMSMQFPASGSDFRKRTEREIIESGGLTTKSR